MSSALDSLLINDREEVYNGTEPAVEPKEAIEELALKGKSAIPSLVPLVERYEKEKEGTYCIEYVIEILGRIGGDQAVQLILRTLLFIKRK